jgi:hypothetical protein
LIKNDRFLALRFGDLKTLSGPPSKGSKMLSATIPSTPDISNRGKENPLSGISRQHFPWSGIRDRLFQVYRKIDSDPMAVKEEKELKE